MLFCDILLQIQMFNSYDTSTLCIMYCKWLPAWEGFFFITPGSREKKLWLGRIIYRGEPEVIFRPNHRFFSHESLVWSQKNSLTKGLS